MRSLESALAFYRDALGLKAGSSLFQGRAVMLTGGRTHHEIMLIEVGEAPGPLQGRRLGLYHFAWKVGESLAQLRDACRRLQQHGVTVRGMADHTISQSLYLQDPDGNEVELFVDNPAIDWRNDESWTEAPVRPLDLQA